MQLVLDDPALMARLGRILEPELFRAELQTIISERGLETASEMPTELFKPDLLGLHRWDAAPVTVDGWPGDGWLPVRSVPTESEPRFDWAWFGDESISTPFYEDAVRRATSRPFNRMFRTQASLAALINGASGQEVIPPSGFIFHMSRCGSTLLGQMLGAVSHHIMVSEAEPLDAVVQWAAMTNAPDEVAVRALRAMVAALGRKRAAEQRRFFIKLDAWHTPILPLFRRAFPDVPWVFIYRDPVEVLVSHLASPGVQTVPGILPEAVTGIANATSIPQDIYRAQILARICHAVADNWQLGGGMAVDYVDLVEAGLSKIPQHFGFVPGAAEMDAFKQATTRHAKYPDEEFTPDSRAKQERANDDVRALAQQWMQPAINRLKTLQ